MRRIAALAVVHAVLTGCGGTGGEPTADPPGPLLVSFHRAGPPPARARLFVRPGGRARLEKTMGRETTAISKFTLPPAMLQRLRGTLAGARLDLLAVRKPPDPCAGCTIYTLRHGGLAIRARAQDVPPSVRAAILLLSRIADDPVHQIRN